MPAVRKAPEIAVQTSSKTLPGGDLNDREELTQEPIERKPMRKTQAQQLSVGNPRVEDPRNSLHPSLTNHGRHDDQVVISQMDAGTDARLEPLTKEASVGAKVRDAGTDARVRDMATAPRYNEKGNDPKMRDTACDAWKRDGGTQTVKKEHVGQYMVGDRVIEATVSKKERE